MVEEPRQGAATSTDELRQVATKESLSQLVAADTRVVDLLERENEFLRNQIAVKDKQIAEQQERAHETNTLINGLQRLIAPLLSAPDRERGRAAGEE
jgi:adenine deaminase